MKKYVTILICISASLVLKAQPCSDLFFSEYVEGGANNKAFEIYNPTLAPVNLTGYQIQLFANGGVTPTNTLNLNGTLAPSDVYVISNSGSNSAIQAIKDTNSSTANFNGNDAIVLLKGTDTLDIIGVVGVDPGTNWAVGTGSTLNFTLVRMSSIQDGTTNWGQGATQWLVLPQDSIQLGSHTMTSCAPPVDTLVRFEVTGVSVAEDAGTYNLRIVLNQSVLSGKTVDVALMSGDTTDIGGYTTQTVTIPADSISQTLVLTIADDAISEGNELFVFKLTNPSSGLTMGGDSIFTLTILLNDSTLPPPPQYSIATITTINGSGVADSLGVKCIVGGVVYGINNRSAGLQFTINDGTGGIGVFSSAAIFGYTVSEGDSIVVMGTVEQFSGLTQMGTLDTVYKAGTGALLAPVVVTALGEATESELVRINNARLVTPSQWDNTITSGFTVDITSDGQTFKLRIDEQSDIFNLSAPPALFDVIGIGGQFDSSSPFDSGYQINPRYTADLLLRTGINDKQIHQLVVYPNPNNGLFTVQLKENKGENVLVKITDVAGKIVFEKEHTAQNSFSIDMGNVETGIYFLEISSGTFSSRGKILVN